MAWSDAARRASAMMRRLHAKPKPFKQKRRRNVAIDKASIALHSYKPSSKEKQRLADEAEARIEHMMGGMRTDDNRPVDVLAVSRSGKNVGVEVKSVSDNKNDKITMHPPSIARKVEWSKLHKAELHTVVVDLRGPEPKVSYRAGIGSFRLHTLTPVKDATHLKELLKL